VTAVAVALLLCPICAIHRAQTGTAALLLLGMIFVPYFIVGFVVRAIRRADE
jgi:hypothetical protein